MIVRFQVDERLPLPARNALNVVQTALKVNRSVASKLIHDGMVACRGRGISQTHHMLRVGDEVEIDYVPQPVKQPAKKKTSNPRGKFDVVHDDEAIIVVNKPAGLLTVPSPQREKNTLRGQLQKWLRHQKTDSKAICVHRLDRGVSGLLVFAKSDEVAEHLIAQFSQRKPQRQYVAIVQGVLSDDKGTFRSHLATDEQSLNRFSVDESDPRGELAITHYRVKERWKGVTIVEVQLETGRRNQIRVHFAEAGHPIIGDPRYRPAEAEHALWPHRRIALHAETLGFRHPTEDSPLLFKAPWPQEFRDLRRSIGPDSSRGPYSARHSRQKTDNPRGRKARSRSPKRKRH
ncbi:MAG: RluA family pseudouridine synthase [Planctomycetota bacterium]|nr:RluA family pseudouridine synthase [Planctomycetota bacterium]